MLLLFCLKLRHRANYIHCFHSSQPCINSFITYGHLEICYKYFLLFPAIINASPSHCDSPGRSGAGSAAEKMERDKRPTSIPVYLAVAVFGISATLPIRSIWVELPALQRHLPEGTDLPLYFLIILECSAVATLCYMIARRCANNRLSEVPFIYSAFALGLTSLLVLGFFWNHEIQILGESHSFVLLICYFLAAIISSVSMVTYIPFTARLRESYITAILLGEALGSFIPHLLAVGQGIGRKPECPDESELAEMNITRPVSRQSTYRLRSTTRPTLAPPALRYPENLYFFVCAGVLGLGVMCFIVLRCSRSCKFEYTEETAIDNMVDDAEMAGNTYDEAEEDVWQTQCDGAYMLDDGSVRQTEGAFRHAAAADRASCDCTKEHKGNVRFGSPVKLPRPRGQAPSQSNTAARLASTGSSVTKYSDSPSAANNGGAESDKPKSFPLLVFITLWTSCVIYGPLSSVKTYACYPTGNTAFQLGALLTDAFIMLTCLIAAKCSSKQQVTIVIAMTCLGTILLTYFVALIGFSHGTDSRASPLFGHAGELLGVSTSYDVIPYVTFSSQCNLEDF